MAKTKFRIAPFGKFRKLINDMSRIEQHLMGKRTEMAMESLAQMAVNFIVMGIEQGRPGWAELSEMTKAIKGNAHLLIDSRSFINAMKVWPSGTGMGWFAGLPPDAKGAKGQDLNIVGEVHESGVTIEVSEPMRGFFVGKGFPLRDDTKYIVIPPRPWFAPAREELDEHADKVLKPLVDELLARLG